MPDIRASFPKRIVHLDFHTGPDIPDVGADFDPDRFAQTFVDAHVDSVTVFAKCHHGHLYYQTSHPARHPSLVPGLDLLADQIEALHHRGIRAPIYLSVQCDEYAANTHPEWIALTPELQQVKGSANAFEAGWQILDMSSPYQDYLAQQLEEVLDRFAPTDGIFLDMCWDQVSCSRWAIDGMKKAMLDPADAHDRQRYARQVAHQYMGRYRAMVDQAHQNSSPVGVWFNSRPKTNLPTEKKFLRHVEIEALPTGGWGYAYFPYVARFVRSLDMPTLSHTGRFFRSWGDHGGLKPSMALKYECCQILSQGMTSGVGDLLHPRGVLNPSVYHLIGQVYAHVHACEPFVDHGKHLADLAVIVDPALGDNPGPVGIGVVRMLQQLQQQFDLLPPDAALTGYRVVIVPENVSLDASLRDRLHEYLQQGGALIFSGRSALDSDHQPWFEQQQMRVTDASAATHLFLHPAQEVSQNLPAFAHVIYEPTYRARPEGLGRALARLGEPYFPRRYDHFSGHEYTPEADVTEDAAIIEGQRIISFTLPIFTLYANHPVPYFRQLFANCLHRLLPDPLVVAAGPSRLETTVVQTNTHLAIHLLSFSSERRAEGLDVVEDAIPLVDMPLAIRCPAAPSKATLQPMGRALPLEYQNGYAHTRVTLTDGHGLVVLDGVSAKN